MARARVEKRPEAAGAENRGWQPWRMNKGQKSPDSLPLGALLDLSLTLLIAVSSVQLPAR
jgi:hypothetical protein